MIEVVHIVARVTTDMTRFNAGMASMEARAKTTTAKMSLMGMRMTKYLTLPIAGIAYAGVKAATSFQKSMVQIQTQAGASAKNLPKIRKALLDMAGNQVTQGPKELADAYYHLQSVMGKTMSTAGKLKALKDIGHLATIGGSDMESTTSAVAGILRTHLRGAKDTLSIVKTINGIVGSGNMRMPEFVESTGTAVLQIAKLLGMSLKDVGAAEAVFTDENMNANMSMTRLRTSLMMAIHPSQAATKEMEKLGISSEEIGVKMRSKNGFISTLDYLGTAYDAYVKKMMAHGMTHKKALTAANAALFGSFGGSKGASVWATLINQRAVVHSKERQITEKETKWHGDLAKSMHTMSAQFEKAWARMQVALIKFGNAVAPVVLGLAKGLVAIANAFSRLPTPTQHFIAAIAVGLAVLGPLLIMLSSIAKLVGPAGMLAGGFGTIIPLAIIAGAAAFIHFYRSSKTFREWVHQKLIPVLKEVGGFFKWLGEDVIEKAAKKVYHFFADGGRASRWSTIVVPALKAVAHTAKTIVHWFEKIAHWLEALPRIGRRFGKWLYGLQHSGNPWTKMATGGHMGTKDWLHIAGGIGRRMVDPTQDPATRYLYRNTIGRLFRAGGGDVAQGHGYWVGEHGPEWFQPNRSGTIMPNSNGMGRDSTGDNRPMVHIAEMHVRHESDAEIVSGKIARKVLIP